jgi:hypothetical protein
MPIRPFLARQPFEPETISMMLLAFEEACETLGLRPFSDDPATKLVAEKIIELAQRGVRDGGFNRKVLSCLP